MATEKKQMYLPLPTANAQIPAIGFGTWEIPKDKAERSVKTAFECGYRHFDCAAIYLNEAEVGKAFASVFNDKNSNIKREDVWITSKLWCTHHAPERVPEALNKTLKDLQLDYLDLYLVHWNFAFKYTPDIGVSCDKTVLDKNVKFQDTWRAMEKLVDEGKVKHIGVCNFTVNKLKELLQFARIKPAVNQVEMHPMLPQDDLLNWCKRNGIHVTAYSPLGRAGTPGVTGPNLVKDAKIQEIARKYNKSPGNVLLRWGLQRNTSVIPKSTNPDHIRSNLWDTLDFELSADDMEAIAGIGRQYGHIRFVNPKEVFGIDVFGREDDPNVYSTFLDAHVQDFSLVKRPASKEEIVGGESKAQEQKNLGGQETRKEVQTG